MSAIDFMLSVRQQRMLRAVLLDPERQFGSNELIAIGGPGYGAGKRILVEFERSGIVIKTARGNQRLYRVNKAHPIYPELQAICRKTFGIGDTVATELAPFADRIGFAFIFGSVARGGERANSDLDLMIVGDLNVMELGIAIERIGEAIGRSVDLNLHAPEDWNRLQGDRIIMKIMDGERIVLFNRTGGAVRSV